MINVAVTCPVCWAPLGGDICGTCGTRVDATAAIPQSVAARRALLFALIPIGINILTNIVVGVVDRLILSASVGEEAVMLMLTALELTVLVLSRLIVIGVIIVAFFFAHAGFEETRGGATLGRGRAKAAIVIASILLVLWAINVVVLVVQIVSAVAAGFSGTTF